MSLVASGNYPAHTPRVRKDVDSEDLPMVESMERFSGKIDLVFRWQPDLVDFSTRSERAASKVLLLLFDCLPDDAKNELILTQLCTTIFIDTYRSHANGLFAYAQSLQ